MHLEEQYTDLPDGLSGNEDCGQMSSGMCYAMALFCDTRIGLLYHRNDLFDKATINLENGINLLKGPNCLLNKYIQSVKLNGKPYNKTYLQHADIINGGEIVFEMGYIVGGE